MARDVRPYPARWRSERSEVRCAAWVHRSSACGEDDGDVSVFATYSTSRDTSPPATMYLGISASARTASSCPVCQTPVCVGDRVVRVAVPGGCWIVHEGCAALVAGD